MGHNKISSYHISTGSSTSSRKHVDGFTSNIIDLLWIEIILGFPSLSWGTHKLLNKQKHCNIALIHVNLSNTLNIQDDGKAITVKVCLYIQISWGKPTFSKSRITTIRVIEPKNNV